MLDRIKEVINENNVGLMNVAIALVTVGIHQIVKLAAFRCPCITQADLEIVCNRMNTTCIHHWNASYGWSYLFAPSAILLIAGIMSNFKIWKVWTGCCPGCYCSSNCVGSRMLRPQSNAAKKEVGFERRSFPCYSCNCCCSVFERALIAPITWIGFGLLDGEFFACATTSLPYVLAATDTCNDISKLSMSAEFNTQHSISQVAGWSVLTGSLAIGMIGYCAARCQKRKTYYEAKYSAFYRQCEEREFSKAMKDHIQENVTETFHNRSSLSTEHWEKVALLLGYDDDNEKNMNEELLKLLPEPEGSIAAEHTSNTTATQTNKPSFVASVPSIITNHPTSRQASRQSPILVENTSL